MWFDIIPAGLGFHFRLDDRVRHLVVSCYRIPGGLLVANSTASVWRISEDETVQIETAVVFGYNSYINR